MIRKNILLASFSVLLFSSACTKKGSEGATGPAGPSFTGAISGHVSLYDTYGAKQLDGFNTVQLTLKGGATASADANGYYVFNKVTTGTYSIGATASGYAATVVNNVNFLSDTAYQNVSMSQLPNFDITSFISTYNTGSSNDSLIMTFPTDTKVRNLIIFVNNKLPVNNMPGNYQLAYVKPIPVSGWGSATSLTVRVPSGDLNGVNIFYGQKVYYAVYSYVVNDASVYTDEATGKNVYTAVGTGLVDSTLAP